MKPLDKGVNQLKTSKKESNFIFHELAKIKDLNKKEENKVKSSTNKLLSKLEAMSGKYDFLEIYNKRCKKFVSLNQMLHIASNGGKRRLEAKVRETGFNLKSLDRDKHFKRNLHILQSKYFEIKFKINNKKYFLEKLKLLIH